jgi:hypothetical protein
MTENPVAVMPSENSDDKVARAAIVVTGVRRELLAGFHRQTPRSRSYCITGRLSCFAIYTVLMRSATADLQPGSGVVADSNGP